MNSNSQVGPPEYVCAISGSRFDVYVYSVVSMVFYQS